MRLAAVVASADHVCARYRLRAFEPILREAGHSLELHTLPRRWWGRRRTFSAVRDADVVVLQRKLLSRLEVGFLRRRIPRIWFDLDDAVWMRDSFAGKGFESGKRFRRFQAICRASELVIAGNEYLAENSRKAGANRAVTIPTCVDIHRYPLAKHERRGADLVWIGSSSTLQGIEAATTLLAEIGRNVPGVRLKLICDRFVHLPGLEIVDVPWSEATESAELAAADIGISWIPDDPWSRGKCGLKVLQYMAAGLPVITNPVGVHPEMVRHGETGYLVNSASEWVDAVRTLAHDPDLRRRMGAAGRRVVEERYSVEAGAGKWIELITSASAA
jgi:glycosyltransferase involved in cell wall biosynthesis